MGERDALGCTDAQDAPARESVQGPSDEREADIVELAQDLRDVARDPAARERFERRALGTVRSLVERDELVEDPLRRVSAGLPTLDPANDRVGAAA